jgi:integrase
MVRTKNVPTHALALKVAAQLRTQIAEHKHFPKPVAIWDPPFADVLDQYVREAHVVDGDGYKRYATYWTEAPETKGKTCRQIFKADARAYRKRRQTEGAPGAKRNRGGGSIATLNKELRFACGAYNEFIAQVEERNERATAQGRTPEPIPSNPFASSPGRHRRQKEALYEPEPETLGRSLSISEARSLFAALPDRSAKRKVLCAVLSGVDLTPMFSWTWSANIEFEARVIRGMRRKGRGKVRHFEVPMNEDLYRELRAVEAEQIARWGKRSMWVWPNAQNTGPDDGDEFVRVVFKRALVKAEIVKLIQWTELTQVRCRLWKGKKQVPGFRTVHKVHRQKQGKFRWKDLRHTFTSLVAEQGSVEVIPELLGHAKGSKVAERVYIHASARKKRAAVDALNGLFPTLTESGTESGPMMAPSTDTEQ